MRTVAWGLLVCAVLVVTNISQAIPSERQNTSAAIPPFDTTQTALSSIVWGKPKQGYAYLINGGATQGLRAFQSVNGGVLVKANLGLSEMSANVPDTFFLQTSRQMADGEVLPSPLCGVYTGLFRYNNVIGSPTTIHKFREISCKPYLDKYKNSTSQKPEETQIPYGVWYSTNSSKIEVLRLKSTDPLPIDYQKWDKIFQRGKGSIFIDKTRIERQFPTSAKSGENPVTCIFFEQVLLQDGDNYLIAPMRHVVSCNNKTFDSQEILLGTPNEAAYHYFCH